MKPSLRKRLEGGSWRVYSAAMSILLATRPGGLWWGRVTELAVEAKKLLPAGDSPPSKGMISSADSPLTYCAHTNFNPKSTILLISQLL